MPSNPAADSTPIRIWRNDGRFVDLETARNTPLQVAAANWLALATFAGRFAPTGAALLLDIGSTTSDIVPLLDGRPMPRGRTDPERLKSRELVYTGVRRTPVCALLQKRRRRRVLRHHARRLSHPGKSCPRIPRIGRTADGRPATRAAAHARLARMLCADLGNQHLGRATGGGADGGAAAGSTLAKRHYPGLAVFASYRDPRRQRRVPGPKADEVGIDSFHRLAR